MMLVSNLRTEIDQNTFEPSVIVDVKISAMVLYEINLYNEEIRNDLLMVMGKELIEQIQELRLRKLQHDEQRNC